MYLTLNIVCVCVCVSVSGESVPFSLWGAVVPTPSRYILHSYTLDVCMCTVMYKYRPSLSCIPFNRNPMFPRFWYEGRFVVEILGSCRKLAQLQGPWFSHHASHHTFFLGKFIFQVEVTGNTYPSWITIRWVAGTFLWLAINISNSPHRKAYRKEILPNDFLWWYQWMPFHSWGGVELFLIDSLTWYFPHWFQRFPTPHHSASGKAYLFHFFSSICFLFYQWNWCWINTGGWLYI